METEGSTVPQESPLPELAAIGKRLSALRLARGWTQTELATRSGLQRPQINYFESGHRTPDLGHVLRLCRALEAPLQQLLSGEDRPGGTWPDLAFELRALGLIDLWVERPRVPGAFRRRDEVIATIVGADEPEARVLEAVPALLAWNTWHVPLLYGYGLWLQEPTLRRLAWLADVTLTLDRAGGFPGGCPGRADLARFVRIVPLPPADAPWDGLGRPVTKTPSLPISKRWRIGYGANLETFRIRASDLLALHQAEGRELPERWE